MKGNKMEKHLPTVAIVAALLALGVVGTLDHTEAVRQAEHYCEMVSLHKQSNGQYGWPDFHKTYDETCKE